MGGGFSLDRAQQRAAEHFKGPALVLAPPGSGKTAVITHRVSYLIKEKGIAANRILVITFTKEAAISMENRSVKMDADAIGAVFATFHSFYFNILKSSGVYHGQSLIFDKQRKYYLKAVIKEITDFENNEVMLNEIARAISYFLNTNKLPETKTDRVYDFISPEKLEEAVSLYQIKKQKANVMDFDDMIFQTYSFLLANPEMRQHFSGKYDFILVDEAQDMNPIQFDILLMLLGEEKNVFFVGDDDQSIYGFRGADPLLLVNLPEIFPETVIYYLEVNYRCDRSITDISSKLISNNKNRFNKKIRPASAKDGGLFLLKNEDVYSEAKKIAGLIKELLVKGERAEDIAILYRSYHVSEILLKLLIKEDIPVFVKEIPVSIYENEMQKDLESFLRLAAGGGTGKREDFLRVINKPYFILSADCFCERNVDLKKMIQRMDDFQTKQKLRQFLDNLLFIKRLTPKMAVSFILKGMGYGLYLDIKKGDEEDIEDQLEEIRKGTEGFGNIENYLSFALAQRRKKEHVLRSSSPKSGIGLYTFHGAKGLEFDNVFIIGLIEGVVPSEKSKSLEEERRLLYVAVTRAKHKLYLSVTGKRNNKMNIPSRFLKELGKQP
ncbi:MAG: ATP-dependent helicase [Lachnospiraceae bacterium]|nr:ATP-dependent helicase [Lachnospiraceae bacterium]